MDQSKVDAARAKIALGQATMNEGVAELLEATAPVVEPPAPEPKPPVVEPPKEEPKPVDPKPPASGPVTSAKTLAALTTALKAAKAGEVIELAAGEYGAYSLKGLAAPGVTVRAAGAKVTGLVLTACEGIAFEDLATDLSSGGRVLFDGCKNIGLIRLTSRNAKLYGVSIQRSLGVEVVGADIADVKDCVHVLNSRGVRVEGCKFRRFRSDSVNLCGAADVKIIGNDVADCLAVAPAHPDGIQFQTSAADFASENIEIRGNKMRRGSGAIFQGIFIKDETGRLRYRNVVIADNDIEGGMYNGILVSSTDGFEVTGNRVQPYADMDSRIQINGSTNGRVEGNASAVYQKDAKDIAIAGNAALAAIAAR